MPCELSPTETVIMDCQTFSFLSFFFFFFFLWGGGGVKILTLNSFPLSNKLVIFVEFSPENRI